MASSETPGGSGETPSEAEQIQADIEKTRADLAETVDALSSRVTQQKQQATTALVRVGIGAGVLVVAIIVVKQIQKRRS